MYFSYYWPILKETFRLGIKSLFMHSLRSMLTILGIVFGVCAVIAMLAIGEGASKKAQQDIAKLGSTNLIIETVRPPQEQGQTANQSISLTYGLTYSDAETIRNTIPNVEVIVPIREISQEARFENRKTAVKIIGTIPWHTEIFNIKVLRGRFITSTDIEYNQSVCVIEQPLAEKLFAFEDPLGRHIKIASDYYKVVGISEEYTENNGGKPQEKDKSVGFYGTSGGVTGNVYIPLSTSRERFSEYTGTMSSGQRSIEKVELQKIVLKTDSFENVMPLRDVVDTLLKRLHKLADYRIIVPLEIIKHAADTQRIFSIVLGSIAAISLLVGGIGIMNIMLATVSERTREIGIRRALGARKKDIIIQFLSETLLLTFAGGIIGIILGCIIPFVVTYFANMPTVITIRSLVLSFGISACIGIVFGLYPAYRAANMDPIESLRHE